MATLRSRRGDSANSGFLASYLRDINETPLLSADEERRLARRIADGDLEARDHCVRANLRLVVSIARRYSGRGMPLQDLIAEGNLGLLRAVEGFNPDLNTRFSTYAAFWIKQAIKRALINQTKTVRLPAYMVDLLAKWRRESARLEELLGRTPTFEEIGRRLELPPRKLRSVRKGLCTAQAQVRTDCFEDGVPLGEVLVDTRGKSPDRELDDMDALRSAYSVLEELDPREAAVVEMRFGLGAHQPHTLKQIGDSLGLSRERVRQLESRALTKLAAGVGAAVISAAS